MFDVPLDAWYVWLGVAAASVAAFGTVAAFPSGTPPDAIAAADAIDRVAAGPPGGSLVRDLDARVMRLRPHGIELRNAAGSAAASLAYGPVTPAGPDDRFAAVLDGDRPSEVFASPAALQSASRDARRADPSWRNAPDQLTVRRVAWEDADVTLVG